MMFCVRCLFLFGAHVLSGISSFAAEAPTRPNILFIAMDDLNDWIGVLGGHPQTITPNIDRLAKSGVLFTNAHCTAPSCNPSRSAIFTGISPHKSGLYDNAQKMREIFPKTELLPRVFSKHGYYSAGSGKMLHYFIDAPSWDEYYPEAKSEYPFPRTNDPKQRPVTLPRGGPWQYNETDWAALDLTEEEYGGDYLVADWIGQQLGKKHDKPFFLACGIYRPHEPWFVPKKYYEPFPLESIQLPPGYKADDLDDLPPEGKRIAENRYFAHIQKEGQWKNGIQGYLASIHYADAMLGKVLAALDASPHARNTIVVLWSDHGWHLGEKNHWQKYTGWRACTRVPLIMRVPSGVPGLPAGTQPARCNKPVNLVSLFPTLLELCGLPAFPEHDGPSLVPLLRDAKSDWDHLSATFLAQPGSYSLSGERWRLIHYANGEEELYDIKNDPYEWKNLAADPAHAAELKKLRDRAPAKFAAKPAPSLASLPTLKWQVLKDDKSRAPASKPDGSPFEVTFLNQSAQGVKLWWVDPQQKPLLYGEIETGKSRVQKTRPGAVWLITDQAGQALGYFEIGDRAAKAIVPK